MDTMAFCVAPSIQQFLNDSTGHLCTQKRKQNFSFAVASVKSKYGNSPALILRMLLEIVKMIITHTVSNISSSQDFFP